MPTYLMEGVRLGPDDLGFIDALADAYRNRRRPICLCTEAGAEMYVAHLGSHFVLKRMPLTSDRHAAGCPSSRDLPISYPRRSEGAIEEPPPGMTSIRLAFAMSQGGTSDGSAMHGVRDGATTDQGRLSLGGLLSYLWERAALTKWHPGFAGKRNWVVVRKRLLEIAQLTLVGRRPLSERLYIPERFRPDDRAAIHARRSELWRQACTGSGSQRRFVLAIGEVKQIEPASSGGHLVLKHVPDPVFILNPAVYASACQCFDRELSLWRASDQIRLMLIATFIPCEQAAEIRELSLMPLTWDWLPGRPIASESASRHSPRRTQGRARQQEVAVTPVGGAHLGGTY